MKHFLPVDVYSNGRYDCTNGGVTSTNPTRLVVEHPQGHIAESELEQYGYTVLEHDPHNPGRPSFRPAGQGRGMFGGNFVWSSDSRFRNTYGPNPVPVHDRFE